MLKKTCRFLAILLGSLLLTINAEASGIDDRIKSVGRLLTVSSAAKKIETSNNEQAKAMLNWGREQHQKAIEAQESGDTDSAKELLGQATNALFAAAKRADGKQATAKKHARDYTDRKQSTEALLKQYRRVAKEKKVGAEAEEVEAEAHTMVAEAEIKADAKDFVTGRQILDKAYNLVKLSIVKLRNGEQLVNSLNFATPKDEYAYYVGKIKSQRMAISIFVKKIDKPARRKTIARIISRANKDQKKAKALAATGNHEDALPLMESVLNKLRSGLMMVVR